MSYLRHALTVFLLLLVMALVVPLPASQDDNKTDDASSQSDSSNDQQSDLLTLSDFLFEHPSILHSKFRDEICPKVFCKVPDEHLPVQISSAVPILAHIFISQCGLMPRAPAQA